MYRVIVVPVFAVITLVGPTSTVAQETGPSAGTWGAEGSIGTASILKFRSPASAWMLSGAFAYSHEQVDNSTSLPFPGSGSSDIFSGRITLGARSYSRVAERTRPFRTLGGVIGYRDDSFGRGWNVGGSLEVGAAHFFSSHVSLGVSGAMTLVYETLKRDFGAGPTSLDVIALRLEGFRLLAGVYF